MQDANGDPLAYKMQDANGNPLRCWSNILLMSWSHC